MKKGRFSKEDEKFIKDNIELGHEGLATELDRDPESVLGFIKKKVAKGDLPTPTWLNEETTKVEQAQFDLQFRPYWVELEMQFTKTELELFKYHWARIISQCRDDVMPTEELQVVDLIKLELLMNRCLKNNKDNMEQISEFDEQTRVLRRQNGDGMNTDEIFNLERQMASLRASQESLNKDYRELQTKKNAMLKETKATREQRVKRLEDSKQSFTSWLAHLISNPDVARSYGLEMEKMRLAMGKEKERLSKLHEYQDKVIDQPFLTPDTVED
jgi:hypothetical protein